MSNARSYLKKAVDNIVSYGDTDIFPFPVDNIFFKEDPAGIVDILEAIHKDFYSFLNKYPVNQERGLQAVGYYGFRWGTQIDPIWNCYLLALVISISDDIEKSRISVGEKRVFSYRYKYDKKEKSLFDKSLSWKDYIEVSVEKSKNCSFVLKCDISDFYPRVYHHRVENALKKCTSNTESVKRITVLLSKLSKGVSYGLPVGGPASRILSELLLNRVDKLLRMESVEFTRYADDYLIFCDSLEDAYGNLIFLSEKLHENEGLSIQKSKTQVMTSEEFRSSSEFSMMDGEDPSDEDKEEINFLRLRLFYDPYSPTADEDYESLRDELDKFDIIGMLGREVNKSRINQALTRRLVNSVKYLKPMSQKTAILSMTENMDVLYPVFPSVMMLTRALIEDLDEETLGVVFNEIRRLLHSGSYITKVAVNRAYAIRVLSHDLSDETDVVFGKVVKEETNLVIKRDLILAMAQRNVDYWVSDRLKYFNMMSDWEKRSLLLSSYILGDEGQHWREKVRPELSLYDSKLLDWFSRRYSARKSWGVVL